MGNKSSTPAYGSPVGDYDDVPPPGLVLAADDLASEVQELHDAYSSDLATYLPNVLPQGLDTRVCYSATTTEHECDRLGGAYGTPSNNLVLTRLATFVDHVTAHTAAVTREANRAAKQLDTARADAEDLRRLLSYIHGKAAAAANVQALLQSCEERAAAAEAELAKAQAALDALDTAQAQAVTLQGGSSGADAYRTYQALLSGKSLPPSPVCVRTYPQGPADNAAYARAQAAGFACAPNVLGLRVLGPYTRALRTQFKAVQAAQAAQQQARQATDNVIKDMEGIRADIQAALAAANLPPSELVTLQHAIHKSDKCAAALAATLERVAVLQAKLNAATAQAQAARTAAAMAQADAVSQGERQGSAQQQAVSAALTGASATDKQAAAASLLAMIQAVIADKDAAHVAADLAAVKAAAPANMDSAAQLAAQNVLFLRNFADAFFAAVYTAGAQELAAKDAYFKQADTQGVMLRDGKKRELIVYKALTFAGAAALVTKALLAYMDSAGMRRLRMNAN